MKHALEQSAHMYSYASKQRSKAAKTRAQLRLQREAMRFAAQLLEELVLLDGGARRRRLAPAVKELRAVAATLENV